jgi:hypothetical protein
LDDLTGLFSGSIARDINSARGISVGILEVISTYKIHTGKPEAPWISMGSSLKSIIVPRHVQILCSSRLSWCTSLSLISFETDSQLTRIQSNAFYFCSSLKSITISRYIQILYLGCFFYCNPLSSISLERDSELKRIESIAFNFFVKPITIASHLQLLSLKIYQLHVNFIDLFEMDS